jgi:hypothetical protein
MDNDKLEIGNFVEIIGGDGFFRIAEIDGWGYALIYPTTYQNKYSRKVPIGTLRRVA